MDIIPIRGVVGLRRWGDAQGKYGVPQVFYRSSKVKRPTKHSIGKVRIITVRYFDSLLVPSAPTRLLLSVPHFYF